MLLFKIIKKVYLIFPALILLFVIKVISANNVPKITIPLDEINKFATVEQTGVKVSLSQLPAPYNDLLTQPLMTKAIEKYYGRTAIVKPIEAKLDSATNIYHRSILMLVDKNKERNNPGVAETKNETIVAELAFIKINFNALPQKIVNDVLQTNVPFGRLLTKYQLQIMTQERSYFKVSCNKTLSALVHCPLNRPIYGRTNTIIRADNKKWLAHVIEILPNPTVSK